MPMRYCLYFMFFALGAASPAMAASASASASAHPWVCAGHFEKQRDRDVASHGIRVYRERFLARRDGAVRRAVFVFPIAFAIMRDHLRSQSAARFGEAAFTQHAALDLNRDIGGRDDAAASTGAAARYEPGDQIAALVEAGIRLESAAAVRVTTKPYNGVPSKNGWSELHMVALDGASIVGIDSTLIVLWRRDSHEEWSTGPSGRLLDFGKHRVAAKFVTSSEFALMERLGKLYNTPFGLFPLAADGPPQKDAAAWRNARGWLERYKENPDGDLQATPPGRC